MGILNRLFPDSYERSLYEIPEEKWRKWYAEGKKAVIFDIDNTLVPHGAPADKRAAELFERLKETGFKAMLLSNNGKERVEPFARAVGAEYISKAGKPSRKGYIKACRVLGLKPREVLFAGDQIFTDIMGAKNAGITAVLVEPIDRSTDIFRIKLKRIPERFIVSSFKRGRGIK